MGASGLLALLLLAAGTRSVEPAQPESLAITGVTIIDVTGGPVRRGMTVVIRGGRIAAIESDSGGAAVTGARRIPGRGKFLIPGLWDMHVHLSWSKGNALPALVANGITGVRDMGGSLPEIDGWRTLISAGILRGPRILRVGPILNGQKFNAYQMVPGNPDETRGVARALKEAGVDFLKVHRRLPRDSYFALIDEAKRLGLSVVGHIPMTVTPEEASDAGQATLEHTETLFEGTFTAGLKDENLADAIRRFRAEAGEKLFARFVANHTVVTPTLAPYRSYVESLDPALPPDPHLRYVAQSFRKEAEKTAKPATEAELAELKRTFAELREVVGQMIRSGVTIMTGTDLAATRVPGFPLHDELALLVDAGATPLQALAAATWTPARIVKKVDELGTVEVGKLADLVLLDANPLEDIRNTRRISAVVLAGKLLDRRALDALLEEAERQAARN